MKKTISVIMAAAMLASSAVAFSSFADGAEGTGGEEKTYSDYVLNCGDEKPVIDGEIDNISLTVSSTSLIVLIPRKKESSGRAEDMRAAPLRKRQSS